MMTYEKLETILRRMSDCAYDLEKSAEILDHDQAQRARIQELEQWQKIVIGTGTDQESVIRMAATEYTKVAIQSWQEKCEQQAKEIATLRDALQAICLRAPIMGSTGEYRAGQLDALEAVRQQVQHALKEVLG